MNMSEMNHKRRWLVFAIVGLLCTGAGLCMAIDAGFCKYSHQPWILYGTISLVIFNTGLCCIGQAVYHKSKFS